MAIENRLLSRMKMRKAASFRKISASSSSVLMLEYLFSASHVAGRYISLLILFCGTGFCRRCHIHFDDEASPVW